MSTLAVDTPLGRDAVERERAIIVRAASVWYCHGIHLNPHGTAKIDGQFIRDDQLIAVAEVKSRDMSLSQLRAFRIPAPGYLITDRKLLDGQTVARLLQVPYYLLAGLTSGEIAWWQISNKDGQRVVNVTVLRCATRATVNGGTAVRLNAFVSLEGMRLL